MSDNKNKDARINLTSELDKKKTFSAPVIDNLYDESDYLKDCPDHEFVPTTLEAVERIVVIGDIHGDLKLAIKSFILAKLIDNEKDMKWIAEPANTVVVQVGDQVDSCRFITGLYDCHGKENDNDLPEDMKVIDFFNLMHDRASKKGGAVHSLLGNHELMNAQGNYDYVSYNNYYKYEYEINGKKYKKETGRQSAFKPGGEVSKMLACTRKSVLVIGSNMFIHAGILPKLVENLDYLNFNGDMKLKYLNAIVRKWLLKKLSEKDQNDKNMFINDKNISPFWTRIYGVIPEKTSMEMESTECFNSVRKILKVFQIGHIIVGHTPQLFTNGDGINGTCYDKDGNNKLFRVDGGFSRAFRVFDNHNMVQVLEIKNDKQFTVIRDTGFNEIIQQPYIDEVKEKIDEKEMAEVVAPILALNRVRSKSKSLIKS